MTVGGRGTERLSPGGGSSLTLEMRRCSVVSTSPFNIVEREDLTPMCPHCGAALAEVYARKRGVPLLQGRSVLFFCPACSKVLGFGQERIA